MHKNKILSHSECHWEHFNITDKLSTHHFSLFRASSVSTVTTNEPLQTSTDPLWMRGRGHFVGAQGCIRAGCSCQPAVFKCQFVSLDQLAFQWHHLPSNPCLPFHSIYGPAPPLHKPSEKQLSQYAVLTHTHTSPLLDHPFFHFCCAQYRLFCSRF